MRPGDHAVYLVGDSDERVRIFMNWEDANDAGLSAFERSAMRAVEAGFDRPENFNLANDRDPYRIAESILAERYGSARMVEARYDWRPRVRY